MKLENTKDSIDTYFDTITPTELLDVSSNYSLTKKIIVFEGIHGVGKTTLLKQLHNPQKGVINLYQTDMWDKLKHIKNNIEDSEHYNNQFVSSFKSQIYFIQTLFECSDIHTIFIDRWFLTSVYESLKSHRYNTDFGTYQDCKEYVDGLVEYIETFCDLHTYIFTTSKENMEHTYYPTDKNINEISWVSSELFYNVVPFLRNKHIIYLEYEDGVFDIKNKFLETFHKEKNLVSN